VWDTAGQEKFAVMAKSYYKRAHGMIIACAINNRSSFENLRTWLNSVKENAESEIQIILLANKCDLEEEREVKKEEIKSKADDLGIEFFETSAKTNTGIDEAFDKVIQKVFKVIYSKPKGIELNDNNEGRAMSGSKCCS
jgi:small GTP-binding protein